jgi:hypothetical protein
MITRYKIKKARNLAKTFFRKQIKLRKKSKIYINCRHVLRSNNFTINYRNSFKCLNNIDFIYDPINKHWAETDGISISINTYKDFTLQDMTYTLIHEAMHGIIYRDSKHELPEEKEHKIMELVNPLLLY